MMDKQVKPIQFNGTNPRVLTKPLQNLLFSLTHICRNIADHGIEPPVTRMARGKDAAGLVTILCDLVESRHPDRQGKKDLRIVISDDGNGIDPSRVREKLAIKDPEGDWRLEDDQKVIQRILGFGFTTADEVTALSGRGVGMEAVEMEVSKLAGSIRVTSELYKGASFDIRVPYIMHLRAQEDLEHEAPKA
jgi:chemotaxis protein histidine kinase CheA